MSLTNALLLVHDFSQNRDLDKLNPANSDNRDWEYFDIPKEFV
jgi:hypothetical protein